MMDAGSVEVTELDASHDPVPVGTGMALAIYQGLAASQAGALPNVPTTGQTSAPYSVGRPANAGDVATMREIRLRVAQGWASMATGIANGVVDHIQAFATVDLTPAYANVSTEKLGRTPDPLAPNADIQPPSSPVHVPLRTDAGTTLKVS